MLVADRDPAEVRARQILALTAGLDYSGDGGIVLRGTWADPDPRLTNDARWRLTELVEDAMTPTTTYGSTDQAGRYADAHEVAPDIWCVRYVDDAGDDYRLFDDEDVAWDWYAQTIRGRADATAGRAWETTDVVGVLCGEDLRLARAVGYTYGQVAPQYATDPKGTREVLEVLAGLHG